MPGGDVRRRGFTDPNQLDRRPRRLSPNQKGTAVNPFPLGGYTMARAGPHADEDILASWPAIATGQAPIRNSTASLFLVAAAAAVVVVVVVVVAVVAVLLAAL